MRKLCKNVGPMLKKTLHAVAQFFLAYLEREGELASYGFCPRPTVDSELPTEGEKL